MKTKSKLSVPLSLLATLLLLALTPAAFATNQVVSDCADNGGPNQLRAKLAAAQTTGGGTITFTCGRPQLFSKTAFSQASPRTPPSTVVAVSASAATRRRASST